jgi:predicted CopG family antitoxin
MASRNIAITEDLYEVLSRKKMDDESFTKVIYRILGENEKPSDYFGSWSDLTPVEEDSISMAKDELRALWIVRNRS